MFIFGCLSVSLFWLEYVVLHVSPHDEFDRFMYVLYVRVCALWELADEFYRLQVYYYILKLVWRIWCLEIWLSMSSNWILVYFVPHISALEVENIREDILSYSIVQMTLRSNVPCDVNWQETVNRKQIAKTMLISCSSPISGLSGTIKSNNYFGYTFPVQFFFLRLIKN